MIKHFDLRKENFFNLQAQIYVAHHYHSFNFIFFVSFFFVLPALHFVCSPSLFLAIAARMIHTFI